MSPGRHVPLLSAAFFLATGIAFGEALLYFPFSAASFLVVALAAGFSIARRRRTLLTRPAVMAGCLVAGIFLHADAGRLSPGHVAHLPEGEFMMEGLVRSFPEGKDNRQSFIIEAEKAVMAQEVRPVSGRVRVSMEMTSPPVRYGDRLRLTGRFQHPVGLRNPGGFDHGRALAREGVHLAAVVGRSDRVWILGHGGNGLYRTIDRWRGKMRDAAAVSLEGPARAVVLAMTIGDERFVTEDVRDAFMVSGTTHILSISGSHVGLIAFLLYNMLRFSFRLLPAPLLLRATLHVNTSRVAAALTIPAVILYTLLAGAEIPTVRSTIMVVTFLAAILIGRGNQPLNSLALALLLTLLFDPMSLFSISFQLSFLTVLLLCLAVEKKAEKSLAELLEKKTWKTRLRDRTVMWLLMSLAATVGTLPLVALYFNTVPWVGTVANSIVIPLAGFVLVPLALFSAFAGITGSAASLPLASWNQAVGDLFYRVVEFFAAIPGAEVHCPSPSPMLVFIFCVSAVGWYVFRRRLLLAGSVLSCLLFFVPLALPSSGHETVADFLDVGQGDATLLRLPNGKTILVDGGGVSMGGFDTGRRVVAPFLWDHGIRRIDILVLSHHDVDHIGGLPYIVRHFEVGEIWEGGSFEEIDSSREIRRLARERGIPVVRRKRGDRAELGGAGIVVLHPPANTPRGFAEDNNRSLVLKVEAPDMTLLLAGDAEEDAERSMLSLPLKADILRVPHHGSRTSSSPPFLAAVKPSVAVVSAGRNNRYGHPALEVLARYRSVGSRVYRTDRDGAIRLVSSGSGAERSVTVSTHNDRTLREVRPKDGLRGLWQVEVDNFRKLLHRARPWEEGR